MALNNKRRPIVAALATQDSWKEWKTGQRLDLTASKLQAECSTHDIVCRFNTATYTATLATIPALSPGRHRIVPGMRDSCGTSDQLRAGMMGPARRFRFHPHSLTQHTLSRVTAEGGSGRPGSLLSPRVRVRNLEGAQRATLWRWAITQPSTILSRAMTLINAATGVAYVHAGQTAKTTAERRKGLLNQRSMAMAWRCISTSLSSADQC